MFYSKWLLVIMVISIMGLMAFGCGNQEPVNDEVEDIETEEEVEEVEETEEMTKRDYFYDMIDYTEEINEAHQELMSLSNQVDFSEEWITAVEEADLRLEEAIVKIEDTTPPSEMEEIHEEYLAGIEKYDMAMEYYLDGIDNRDEDMIKEGVKYLRQGEEHVNRGYTMLYEYGF